jgi:hypothetical protein
MATAAKRPAKKQPRLQSITVEFEYEYETKNKYRYNEVADEGKEIIGSLYVSKKSFPDAPDSFSITINLPG